MPVGASKLGVLGAGLVPGGSVTFNAPGTWPIPPGVKKVSITGRGGTGNPGNAGNPGNPGNPGTGGTGGSGGRAIGNTNICVAPGPSGGDAWFTCRPPGQFTTVPIANPIQYNTYIKRPAPGGPPNSPLLGSTGNSGNAGSAGNAGNPGNPGQPSSGLGNTFPGGAGGNAGVAGAAGNAGSGGVGGAQGGDSNINSENAPGPTKYAVGSGGSGSGGGGSGGSGSAHLGPFPTAWVSGAFGGGGAGTTNSGGNGPSAFLQPAGIPYPSRVQNAGLGGTDTNLSAPANPRNPGAWPTCNFPFPCNTFAAFGRLGGQTSGDSLVPTINAAILNHSPFPNTSLCVNSVNRPSIFRKTSANFNPSNICQIKANVFRNAGGGGSGGIIGGICPFNCPPIPLNRGGAQGGGGAGGGRGNAGNAGGVSPTPTGAAGTPQTFNCVTVTPGATTPITVGTPGGQIVISWNPQ